MKRFFCIQLQACMAVAAYAALSTVSARGATAEIVAGTHRVADSAPAQQAAADTASDPIFVYSTADAAEGLRATTGVGDSTSRDTVRLFTPRDAVAGAGVTALVLAVMPMDRSIAHSFQRNGLQSNGALRHGANVFNAIGFPGAVVFSAGTYFLGLGSHSRRLTMLGMHTGEAIVLGGVITEVLKGTIGRARPYVDVNNPHNFHFGKGFANDRYTSLPSGHVTIAFAAATMASSEVSRSWPDAARYVTPASYGTATLVALARLYKNQHWASDVVAGAGVGTLGGVLFDRYNRAHPDNILDRVFLPNSVVPAGSGVLVGWSVRY